MTQTAAAQIEYQLSHLSGEAPGAKSAYEELGSDSNADALGWQSEHFCRWPQTLTLRLAERSVLSHMQLLSHEYKIPSKIEVWARDDHEYDAACENKLGHFCLSDNSQLEFERREMRTVQLGGACCTQIRLVVLGCHLNKKNLYSQAGIISVRLFGAPYELAASSPLTIKQEAATLMQTSPRTNQLGDLAVDASLDPVTQEQIRRLLIRKQEALAEEDFDEAKRCKDAEDHLREAGDVLRKLEVLKQEAIEHEDYDAAKMIKLEIEQLRDLSAF